MSSNRTIEPIHVGLVSDEPIRPEGLTSIFEQPFLKDELRVIPIPGTIKELLAQPSVEYLVIDLHAASGGLEILEEIHRRRPSLCLIVIGPEGKDELVLESIIAGARAYLELTADVEMVRRALEAVTSGSIWAPRRLLSKLIDRLLKSPDSSLTAGTTPRLTEREHQVLELILQAQSNREIAHQLGIEERTVKAHVGRLMRKTGADNRIDLTMRALNRPLAPGTAAIARRKGEREANDAS